MGFNFESIKYGKDKENGTPYGPVITDQRPVIEIHQRGGHKVLPHPVADEQGSESSPKEPNPEKELDFN